jgi:hypothetical protein
MKQPDKKDIPRIVEALTPAVNAALLAKTFAQCEREKMDKVDRYLLEGIAIYTSEENATRGRKVERVLDHNLLYLADLESEPVKFYYQERQKEVDALGYKLPRGHCPALVAEGLERQARRLLVDCAAEFFGVTFDQVLGAGLEKLEKYEALLIGLVVNFPGYKNPLTGEAVRKAA